MNQLSESGWQEGFNLGCVTVTIKSCLTDITNEFLKVKLRVLSDRLIEFTLEESTQSDSDVSKALGSLQGPFYTSFKPELMLHHCTSLSSIKYQCSIGGMKLICRWTVKVKRAMYFSTSRHRRTRNPNQQCWRLSLSSQLTRTSSVAIRLNVYMKSTTESLFSPHSAARNFFGQIILA